MKGRRIPAAAAVLLLLGGCVGEGAVARPRVISGEQTVAYPIALWDAGVEGATTLRVRVTEEGTVDSIEVAETSGHAGLDSAAVAGVRTLRFEPGRLGPRPTRMWATLPVLFTRRGAPADAEGSLPPASRE